MSIENYRKKFYKLLESEMGNVKPLICENDIDEDKIDLKGTYLDDMYIQNRKSDNFINRNKDNSVSSIKGNQFRDAGKTSNNEYGITFTTDNDFTYKVNFPDEFIQKYFSLPASEVMGSLGPYGDEHGRDLPMNAKDTWGYVKNVRELLNDVYIQTEGLPTNRIHFPIGIPDSLRGTGLGYIIYESFIKFLGWGSSSASASGFAQVVWSKLLQDPDFYSFVYTVNLANYVCCIYKHNKNISPVDIIKKFMVKPGVGIRAGVSLNIGDSLKKDYPELIKLINDESKLKVGILDEYIKVLSTIIKKVIYEKKEDDKTTQQFIDYESNLITIISSNINQDSELIKYANEKMRLIRSKFIETFYKTKTISYTNFNWELKDEYKAEDPFSNGLEYFLTQIASFFYRLELLFRNH